MHSSRRWLMLALGTAAQTSGTAYLYGLPFLIPAFRAQWSALSLTELGVLVAAPGLGMVLAVLAWGALADRRGERVTILLGLGTGALALGAAAFSAPPALHLLLIAAGIGGSAVYAASGKVVVGWFATDERGLAMGIRQASQPVGVAAAGAALPALAAAGGVRSALLALAGISLLACVLCGALLVDAVAEPTQQVSPAAVVSPYRSSPLWRLHGASALLVAAQVGTVTFALVYLVTERGWAATSAGPLIAGAQLVAAGARIAGGRWSDRRGERMAPLRTFAVGAAVALAGLAVAVVTGSAMAVPAILVAVVFTAGWHGIGYAAVAEAAPPSWAGRVLGAQTTAQNAVGALVPPLFGAIITARGFGAAYAIIAASPLLAALALPHRATALHQPDAPPDHLAPNRGGSSFKKH